MEWTVRHRPRAMFWAQIVAAVIAGTTQLGVQSWMFSNIDGICTANQKDGFVVSALERLIIIVLAIS